MARFPTSHRIALCALLSAASLGCEHKTTEEGLPDQRQQAAWVEEMALGRFEERQTLYGLGKKTSEIYDLPPLITSRDPIGLQGDDEAPTLFGLLKPMAEDDRVLVFKGDQKLLDRPLSGKEQAVFSPHAQAIAIYQGLPEPLGDAWTPGTDVDVYHIGQEGHHTVPRGEGLQLGPLLDDGTLFIVDGPGALRRFGPTGALEATLSLPAVHPAAPEPGQARSKVSWLPAQGLIAVTDFTGPADRQGRRIQSGIRLFSMKDGALVASWPSAVEVLGGAADPGRYYLLERPGKLVAVEGGKRTREGLLPGRGALDISPDGDWIAITSADVHLWLFDTGIMSGVWEHTSPEPWNVFMAEGTRVCDGGRVFGARRQDSPEGRMLQMQLFSLDADGSGKVLLERPYQDAQVAPVWIVGATDHGKKVMFGALGEELRVVTMD